MSALIKNEMLKKGVYYAILFIMVVLGLALFSLIIQMVFNLGSYFGTFLRLVYNSFCS